MRVSAFAKINLFLRVDEKRPDGFHELETIFQNINLSDQLVFEQTSQSEDVLLTITPESTYSVDLKENLILKAVKFLEDSADKKIRNIRIHLTKHIPVGAGLGGGSSDSAATLIALNRLCSLEVSSEVIFDIALSLGADVPFFLRGGTALGKGRGERLYSLVNKIPCWYVVVYPGFSVSTAAAYHALDDEVKTTGRTKQRIVAPIESLEEGQEREFFDRLHNDFTRVVERMYPQIALIREKLVKAGCKRALLSGSGSAVFGICSGKEQAEEVGSELGKEFSDVYVCEPVHQGFLIHE